MGSVPKREPILGHCGQHHLLAKPRGSNHIRVGLQRVGGEPKRGLILGHRGQNNLLEVAQVSGGELKREPILCHRGENHLQVVAKHVRGVLKRKPIVGNGSNGQLLLGLLGLHRNRPHVDAYRSDRMQGEAVEVCNPTESRAEDRRETVPLGSRSGACGRRPDGHVLQVTGPLPRLLTSSGAERVGGDLLACYTLQVTGPRPRLLTSNGVLSFTNMLPFKTVGLMGS